MLPDFKLVTHRFTERPDIEIWPISDVHLGAEEHNAEAWSKFVKDLAARENTYAVLVGDLINNCTRSSISNIFRETEPPHIQKQMMAKMLEPIRDKILCAVSGNHERRSGKDADDDPTYDILCKLDLEHLYRENIVFLRIQMGKKGGAGQHTPTYFLTITHGAGGGALTGSSVNKAERFGYMIDGCDVLIVGHTHKPSITPPAKIVIDPQHGRALIKPFFVICSTSWMNYGGYAVQKLLMPSSVAPEYVKLYGREKRMDATTQLKGL